jgi:hypothetical protein
MAGCATRQPRCASCAASAPLPTALGQTRSIAAGSRLRPARAHARTGGPRSRTSAALIRSAAAATAAKQGVPGVVTSDCLFDKEFKRMFEKDGWSGDIKEPGLLNGRAAYTNTVRHARSTFRTFRARVARAPTTSPNHALATLRERGQVNTERYRETMKKEERITAGRNSSMARQSLDMLTERRRESAGAKADALDKMVADRSYKPTSQALSIGTKLEMASSCNPQNYLPPIQMQDGGMMPAAYRCPHAHRALRSPLASSIGC